MTRLLLDNNALAATFMHFDGDQFVIENKPHVAAEKAVLEQNQRMRNSSPNRLAHGRLAASVPVGLNAAWKREWQQSGYAKTMDWMAFKIMKLNDRNYSYLRTSNLKL